MNRHPLRNNICFYSSGMSFNKCKLCYNLVFFLLCAKNIITWYSSYRLVFYVILWNRDTKINLINYGKGMITTIDDGEYGRKLFLAGRFYPVLFSCSKIHYLIYVSPTPRRRCPLYRWMNRDLT